MADGEVKIDTKLDTSGVDKGLKDMKTKLDGAGKTIDAGAKKGKGFADNLKGISTGAVAAAGAVAGVAVAVKKTVDALNECAAAYRVQKNAEEALQIAAKNNPYLNDESVYNLRNFASELQSLSEIGDEVSLQVMSQLAATGRNEEQIMQIMSAAADMAAVTGNNIQNVALQLNKTYSGLAGELGETNGAIRALTKEELENGRAIELVAQQYKGAAAATADVEVQLSNAWGDFKENIGRGWQNVTRPVKQFFLDVLNDINEATSKTNALKDAKGKDTAGTATAADTKLLLEDAQNRLTQLQALNKSYVKETAETVKTLEELQTEWDAKYGKMNPRARREIGAPDRPRSVSELAASGSRKGGAYIQAAAAENQKEIARLEKEVERLTNQYTELKDAEDKAAEAAQTAADAADKKNAAQKRNDDAAAYINANTKALQEQIEAMQLKAAVTGEEIDAGEMYNAYMQSYIDLITKSNGLVTENNQAAKERLATLQEWAQKAKDAATEEERLAAAQKAGEAALQAAESLGYNSKFDEYKAREEELLQMKKDINAAEIEDAAKKQKAIENIDEELVKNRRNLWNDIASEVNGYAQQVGQIINDAAQMALEMENNKMRAELANLEIKYRKGELGEEEYQKKVAEAKKKGAKIQYQIEMAQWASNILTATANTAVGVTQALAQGGVAGIITGALVGAAGAVQLASIMAAKPIKHFAAGGFVGGINGASMGADNTTIAARSGELVMNANQQRALWDMLNGTGSAAGAGGVNLTINNNAANLVNVQPQITRGQIELMIDARVNDGLKSGRFNSGLNAANAGMSGDFYGI